MFAITGHVHVLGPVTVGDLTADEAAEARVKLAQERPQMKVVITYQDDPKTDDNEDDASDLRW